VKRNRRYLNETTWALLRLLERSGSEKAAGGGDGSAEERAARHWPSVSALLFQLANRLGLQQAEDFAEWTFWGSVFFSATVCTSIGYGNMAPRTTLGRAITMLYALAGIPLVLYTLSFIGFVRATNVSVGHCLPIQANTSAR